MADSNTVDRAISGLGSTMVRAGEVLKRARQDFGKAHEPRQRLLTAVIACAAAVAMLFVAGFNWDGPSALDHVEAPLKNVRVRTFEDPSLRDPDILVIAIDERALAWGDVGGIGSAQDVRRYAWPWPRHVYNKLIRYCREGGARVIIFDQIFSESGPNTNDPIRMIVRNDVPQRIFQGDKAGDDLFILEATARDDVIVALARSSVEREREPRDYLLPNYAVRVLDGDVLLQRVAEAHGAAPTPETPISGLLDGRPTSEFILDGLDVYTPEQQRKEVAGYYKALEKNTELFKSVRFSSLFPLPEPTMHGIAGVGAVNNIPDPVDGVQRTVPVFTVFDGQAYRHIALEAWRLYVLSFAREAADEAARTAFTRRFGLELTEAGLVVEGETYALAGGLRDVPLRHADGALHYLGREIPVDDTGEFDLRFRAPITAELDPVYQRADEQEKAKIAEYYAALEITALYPTVSAADVLSDWDVYSFRKEGYARVRDGLKKDLQRKTEDWEDARGPAKEQAEKLLKAAQELLDSYPESGPPGGFQQPRLGEPASLVKDKVVFIAGTASGLSDQSLTPLSPRTPGTYVIANAFDNVKNEDFLHRLPPWVGWFSGVLAVVLSVFGVMYSRKLRNGFLLVIGLASVVLLLSCSAFQQQIWMPTALPMAGLLIGFTHGALAQALTEGRQKRQRESFARQYMGKELLEYVIKNPGSLKLGGENRSMTMYFSDVAGFTTVTETLGPNNPERLVELLNIYLERMTDLMLGTGGVIDKYIGDAIMCFWGAPMSQEDHAVRACRGALLCRSELQRMQPLFADSVRAIAPQLIKPDGTVLNARAGINSGIVTVGNMGSSKRFAYTVMGDAVNLAARLEPQCKEYGTDILIGEKTEAQVRGEFTLRRVDLIVVKGKSEPVQVFELIGDKEVPQFVLDMLKHYEQGIDLFRDRQFEAALAAFRNAAHHESQQDADELNPSRLYIARCEEYLRNPPPSEWNGVFIKKTK